MRYKYPPENLTRVALNLHFGTLPPLTQGMFFSPRSSGLPTYGWLLPITAMVVAADLHCAFPTYGQYVPSGCKIFSCTDIIHRFLRFVNSFYLYSGKISLSSLFLVEYASSRSASKSSLLSSASTCAHLGWVLGWRGVNTVQQSS